MGKKRRLQPATRPDKHTLYEASVQAVDIDLNLFASILEERNGHPLKKIREDFCGTAQLAVEWVRQGTDHESWGIDLDKPTLDWAREHRMGPLGGDSARVHLFHANVLEIEVPKVDLACALNFSYSVFKERRVMLEYFTRVYHQLADDGIFILDSWGGPTTIQTVVDKRDVPGSRDIHNNQVPGFKYLWDQSYFNFIDNHIITHIHFRLKDGTKYKEAFTYDWRLWGLPELRDILTDAGFVETECWFDGWDDEVEDTDGHYARVKEYTEMDSWVGYIAAYKR